ncbi:PUMP1 [Symbiodinium sp. KB8]|nr:PUMP1 [Symbiodinium sp. KB8]
MPGASDATSATELLKRWGVAAVSACAAETATLPLDVTKIRLQLQGEATSGSGEAASRRGMVGMMAHVAKSEGLAGLYGGLSAALIRQVVYGGIGVGMYQPVRKLLIGLGSAALVLQLPSAPFPFDRDLLACRKRACAGMLTGGLGQFVASPTDVVKIRIQADGRLKLQGKEARYRGALHAFRSIAKKEGLAGERLGFFSGVRPSVTRAAVINGCGIAAYDHSKQLTLRITGAEDGLLPRVVGSLISGFVSAVVSTPLDVVKTRLMSQPADQRLYKGMIDCASKTVRGEGLMALYAGFLPAYTRLAPWQVVFFLCFETANKAVFGKAL